MLLRALAVLLLATCSASAQQTVNSILNNTVQQPLGQSSRNQQNLIPLITQPPPTVNGFFGTLLQPRDQYGIPRASVMITDGQGFAGVTRNGQPPGPQQGALVVVQSPNTPDCGPYHLPSGTGASTNATLIATGNRTLCHLMVINTTSTIYYLRLYDLPVVPTCSSTTGLKHTYPIPHAGGAGAGFSLPLSIFGESYNTGLGFCVTGAAGDTDTTNAAAGVYIEASWR